MKFRKKPVMIEAVQFDGTPASGLQVFDVFDIPGSKFLPNMDDLGSNCHLAIPTLEGTMIAAPGDWIIRGIKGEFYPIKPDIFAETYEPSNTPSPLTALSAALQALVDDVADLIKNDIIVEEYSGSYLQQARAALTLKTEAE